MRYNIFFYVTLPALQFAHLVAEVSSFPSRTQLFVHPNLNVGGMSAMLGNQR